MEKNIEKPGKKNMENHSKTMENYGTTHQKAWKPYKKIWKTHQKPMEETQGFLVRSSHCSSRHPAAGALLRRHQGRACGAQGVDPGPRVARLQAVTSGMIN